MNCYYHEHEAAVGTCQDCGKALCRNCLDNFTLPICESCNTLRWETARKNASRELYTMLIIGIAATIFAICNDINGGVIAAIYFSLGIMGAYAGWKSLNCITSKFFLFMPIGGWITYFFIKMLISIIIGIPCIFYLVFKNLRLIRQAKEIEAYTATIA